MTAPVRPSFVPPQAAAPAPAKPDARAAQKAFFEQALGRARETMGAAPTAAARPAQAVRPAPQAAPAVAAAPAPAPSAPAPDRPLRPGSLLDIRV